MAVAVVADEVRRDPFMGLDNKAKELVAVGASIGGDCIPSLIWHSKQSIALGATKDELRDAIEMAIKVKEIPFKKTLDVAASILSGNSSHE